MGSGFWFEVGALVPSLGVGVLFWFAMKALLNADRREREALRDAEREQARTAASTPSAPVSPTTPSSASRPGTGS